MPSVESSRPVEDAAEDEEEPDEILWNLGFVEEPEKPHLLLRHRFPSKVGGRPAWLDPVRLPTREQLTCRASGKPLDFLLQIYAPVDANPVEGFHRSLFLFISPEGSRLKEPGAVRLFRCQLPRSNPYYSSQPPTAKDKFPPALKPADAEASRQRDPWRSVDSERPPTASGPSAGPSGSSPASASKRKGAAAAAAAAARAAAAAAGAAAEAAAATESTGEAAASSTGAGSSAAAPLPRVGVQGPGGLYPELELVVEPEAEEEDGDESEESDEYEEVVDDQPPQPQSRQQQQEQQQSEGAGTAAGRGGAEAEAGTAPDGGGGGASGGGGRPGAAEAGGRPGDVKTEVRRALQQYRARVAAEGELDDEELPPDVVEALEDAATPAQRCFADFQARVARAPQQVIRYCFQDGAQPLWPAPHDRPGPADIPPCPNCGARRKLEFQVLPQLLHYLQLDEQDPSSPDWSTLVGYTCAAACSPKEGADSAYLEELAWVQPPSA